MGLEGCTTVARLVAARRVGDRPVVVAIAGGVAVGKSSAAAALRARLQPRRVETVGTDGYLFANGVLAARGLLLRKGFPETFDADAIQAFLEAVRAGVRGLTVPVYSHVRYDVTGEQRQLGEPDVVVLEGVNALRFADRVDLGVYLYAEEAAMESWYVSRFCRLCVAPPPGSFYEQFRGLDDEACEGLARDVWRGINLVNLREHIEPTRDTADVVVEKRADHSVARVLVRGRSA